VGQALPPANGPADLPPLIEADGQSIFITARRNVYRVRLPDKGAVR